MYSILPATVKDLVSASTVAGGRGHLGAKAPRRLMIILAINDNIGMFFTETIKI